MSKGNIICLNGVSSSGKSTLAKSLQENLKEPYYWMSEDTFVFILPDKFNAFKNDTEENEGILEEALFNYYHTVKLYSDRGSNIIIDTVFDDEDWVDYVLEVLQDNPVLFVHVICPNEELRQGSVLCLIIRTPKYEWRQKHEKRTDNRNQERILCRLRRLIYYRRKVNWSVSPTGSR